MEHKAIYDLVAERLGAAALAFHEDPLEPWAELDRAGLVEACTFLRDDPRLAMDQLMCLSGLDWDGYDEDGKGKSVAILGYTEEGVPETSDRVAEGDLGVAYHLYSHSQRHKFTLRVRMPRADAAVPTVSGVWSTAAWHEREAWDLVGIRFTGHPDLRRMLLDDEWTGHPLRKDYEMPAEWSGVPMKGQPYSENPFAPAEAAAGEGDDTPAED